MARVLIALVAAVAAFAALTAAATATSGDTMRTLSIDETQTDCPGKPNSGITIVGATVLVACSGGSGYGPSIVESKVGKGTLIAVHQLTGLGSARLGPIAYDAVHSRLWACTLPATGTASFGTVDLAKDRFVRKAPAPDCGGGLEYDSGSNTLWTAALHGRTMLHVSTDGRTIKSFDLSDLLGACSISGIAIEDNSVLFSTLDHAHGDVTGCGLFSAPRSMANPTMIIPFSTIGIVADVACDDATFAGKNKTALWTIPPNATFAAAFEAPGSGGSKPPPCK